MVAGARQGSGLSAIEACLRDPTILGARPLEAVFKDWWGARSPVSPSLGSGQRAARVAARVRRDLLNANALSGQLPVFNSNLNYDSLSYHS